MLWTFFEASQIELSYLPKIIEIFTKNKLNKLGTNALMKDCTVSNVLHMNLQNLVLEYF
jgi:hypothetical protein